ncbi:MAG: PAS domain S-box protein [Planctomycetales bacterium]|nr:PAS domain S-box protein [Planctomycetales bacterium]
MRIGLRLTIGFLCVALLVAVVGFSSRQTNQRVRSDVAHLGRHDIVAVVDGSDMAMALHDCHAACHELLEASTRGADGAADAKEALAEIRRSDVAFRRSLSRSHEVAAAFPPDGPAASRMRPRSLEAILDDLGTQFEIHTKLVDEFVALAETDRAAALDFLEHKDELQINHNMLPLIREYKELAQGDMTSRVQDIAQSMDEADNWVSVITLSGMLTAVALGLLFSRYFRRRLARLSQGVGEIADGRFSSRIDMPGQDEFSTAAAAFNRMATQLESTVVSKSYVDNIIRSMHDMLVVVDGADRISVVNQAVLDETGYGEAELIGRPLSLLCGDDSPARWRNAERQELDQQWLTKSGDAIPVQLSVSELSSSQDTALVVVARNIAEQRQTERTLRRTLADKETLLREVHHRVKNNLQIVSSLLSLQAKDSHDQTVGRLFRESQGRIRSMALIHELLYRSDDLASVGFAEYVVQLTGQLRRTYETPHCRCDFQVQVDEIALDLDRAIPCGMIINELATNALEHAFVGRSQGTVRVSFTQVDDEYRLIVEDDGVGCPQGVDLTNGPSLGLKVVDSLVRQLGGTLETESHNGARFTAVFPVASAAEHRTDLATH